MYGASEWNARLPATDEAFFIVKTDVLHNSGPTIELHRHFLQRYGLRNDDCPLLTFDPGQWERPFDRFFPDGGARVRQH